MDRIIDYYMAPISPWTYLGHRRFSDMAKASGAKVNLLPMDLGRVFPVSGGLPVGKRAPQRQAYRFVELRRFADHLGLPLNLQPAFFPAPGDDAARLLVAVDRHDGTDAAMALVEAVTRGVWAEQRNIADLRTLAEMLSGLHLPARRLDDAQDQHIRERYDAITQQAIDAGIFGAPSYVVDGEMFWGQDRLDFVQRRLARAA